MRALLLLLSALVLVETTERIDYDTLEEHDRKIVDEAIKQANELHGKHKHLDFYTIFRPKANTLQVILRPTLCDATTEKVHQKDCKIQNNSSKPQVSCVVCGGESMPCLLLREKEKIKQDIKKCINPSSMVHRPGETVVLLQKAPKMKEIGCLGCI